MGWNTRPVYPEQDWHECHEPAPVFIQSLPAGYSSFVPVGASQVLSPVPSALTPLLGSMSLGTFPIGAAANPQVGAFVRDTTLPAGTLGAQGAVQYVPVNAPSGAIGGFTVGQSPIGLRAPLHGKVS